MKNNLGRVLISVISNSGSITTEPISKRVRVIFAPSCERRSQAQVGAVVRYWRTTVPDFKEANEKIDRLWAQWPAGATTLALAARNSGRETHILKRGDWLKPQQSVTAGVPSFLHPLAVNEQPARPSGGGDLADTSTEESVPSAQPGSRLALARWLVDRRSPTTARVI